MQKLLVIGTGGLAREFTSWFSAQYDIVGYSSLNAAEHASFSLPGTHYDDDVTPDRAGTDCAAIAVGSPALKVKLYATLVRAGFRFPSIVHPLSLVGKDVTLDEGVVLSPTCVVAPNVTIRKLSYLTHACGVGHDAVVGSFVQINPGVHLGGATVIGDQTLLGSGALVLQGINIGAQATIGSGSVVFEKVADGITVMGNPAKRIWPLEKR